MSVFATHIRFALDKKDEHNITEIQKYISGSIYPDSRYITGIDRNLTHNNDILSPDFGHDDFKKGWQTHQLCDKLHNDKRREIFSDIFKKDYHGYNEQEWVDATVIKIIQDMSDAQKIDIQGCLDYLEYAENPNGEDAEKVREFNKIVVELYKGKNVPSAEDYLVMWTKLGIERDLSEKIKNKLEIFLNDENILKRINNLYNLVLT